MLKRIKKWCVFKLGRIIDAYSTKEQAEFKANQLQNEFDKQCESNGTEKELIYCVDEATVNIFVE